jgi:hypothetical protein
MHNGKMDTMDCSTNCDSDDGCDIGSNSGLGVGQESHNGKFDA